MKRIIETKIRVNKLVKILVVKKKSIGFIALKIGKAMAKLHFKQFLNFTLCFRLSFVFILIAFFFFLFVDKF